MFVFIKLLLATIELHVLMIEKGFRKFLICYTFLMSKLMKEIMFKY